MIHNLSLNAFIVELIDYRFNRVKKTYEVKFSIADTYSGDFTKNTYKYSTNNSRSSDEFIREFLREVIRRVGDYIFNIDDRGLAHIEDRHVILFNMRPFKRINLNIRRLLQLLTDNKKCLKTKSGTMLMDTHTHFHITQGYLLISPEEKSDLNMDWLKKYFELYDYNLVQS